MARRKSFKKGKRPIANTPAIQPVEKDDFASGIQAKPVTNSAPGIATFGIGQGFPNNQTPYWTAQLSKVDTQFLNLRWSLVSNLYQFLCEVYAEIGLVQTLVDVPVDDGLRGGIEISSKDLTEDQIVELLSAMDSYEDIVIAGQTAKWNRLFGGAGTIIVTDEDPSKPFNIKEIRRGSEVTYKSADLWELNYTYQNIQDTELRHTPEDSFFNYYGVLIHRSRVMIMRGVQPPSFIRPRMRGWGLSVIETLVRPLNQYLKGQDLTFEVMDEFKIDVYMMKNLANTLMQPCGSEKVHDRIQTANFLKNYNHALVLDTEDEYHQKQLSFAGLAETAKEIRLQIASEMRMPLTKIFGISAAGFNSGEDDIEVYNGMVESQVRNKIKHTIRRQAEIRCQQLFGFAPKNLEIKFKPLREMSSEQEENVKTQKFNRLKESVAVGQITPEEFRDAANRGNLFDIKLKDAPPDLDGYEDEEGIDDASTKNSITFDKKSYEADGGDAWTNPRRMAFYEDPRDLVLWQMCLDESVAAWGSEKRMFTVWLYEKKGGKFN